MADIRRTLECDYCGATFHLKYLDDMEAPTFCCFCSEELDDNQIHQEEDDGDLDYPDVDRQELTEYN